MGVEKKYDIVIVGGGPGGLCAGLYAARARRKTVCLEKFAPGGQIALTGDVEDYIGFEHILGPELADKFLNHAKKFGLEVELEEVAEVYVDGEDRVTRCESGNTYRARAVILATGGSPVYLNVPGEKEYSGKGVSYCAICDGAFFRDKIIAVVGGEMLQLKRERSSRNMPAAFTSSIAVTNFARRKSYKIALLRIQKLNLSGIPQSRK